MQRSFPFLFMKTYTHTWNELVSKHRLPNAFVTFNSNNDDDDGDDDDNNNNKQTQTLQ